MSQVDNATSTTGASKQTPQTGVALIRGRIAARRRITTKNGPQFITIVKLPAPDEYTSPQTVELRSAAALGDAGDACAVKVSIGGYGRSYQAQDPETGEKRTVQTADNSLTVVE